MVLPWIIGSAVVATAGKAISEGFKKKEAEKIIEKSKQIYQSKVEELKREEQITNEVIQDYLKLHRDIHNNWVKQGLYMNLIKKRLSRKLKI